jgi:hypothetical protein
MVSRHLIAQTEKHQMLKRLETGFEKFTRINKHEAEAWRRVE